MATTSHPWDQQSDEPDASYARFLVYRNLGPTSLVVRQAADEQPWLGHPVSIRPRPDLEAVWLATARVERVGAEQLRKLIATFEG